jgi:hypothetical protein
MRLFFKFVFNYLVLGFLVLWTGQVYAQEINKTSNPFEQFSKYSLMSRVNLDHNIWSKVLQKTVLQMGMSDRVFLRKEKPTTGSKLVWGSSSPFRLEGNKVFFHKLDDNNNKYLLGIRMAYEAFPNKIPLENLNKREQLAYWLNLYNATLYYEIANRYPVTNIERLRKSGLWKQKLLTVKDVPMSLDDIQYNILEKYWPDPLVIYGLYQGAVGGPNIQNKAFTGENVYDLLKDNAKEFINSNRGVHFRKDVVRVSVIYERSKALFPNWPQDLKNHLMEFADPLRVMTRLAPLDNFEAIVYDYHIADLYNGQLGWGPGSSQNTNTAGLLAGGSFNTFDLISGLPRGGSPYPYHVRRLVKRMEKKMWKQRRKGIVTIEEVEAPKEPPPQNPHWRSP